MVIVTKPKERAKGTVSVSSVGVSRDAQGRLVYAMRSSDPRKGETDFYYVHVDPRTGEALDCTCPDYRIWRANVVDETCKHMDAAALDAKSKLLDQYMAGYQAVMLLLSNITTFLDTLPFLYPGPLDLVDIEPDRQRLLDLIEQQKGRL